jgi:hypothetical protein
MLMSKNIRNIVSECDLVEAAKKLKAIQPVRLKPDTTTESDRDTGLTRRSGMRCTPRRRAQFGHSHTSKQLPPITEPLIS